MTYPTHAQAQALAEDLARPYQYMVFSTLDWRLDEDSLVKELCSMHLSELKALDEEGMNAITNRHVIVEHLTRDDICKRGYEEHTMAEHRRAHGWD